MFRIPAHYDEKRILENADDSTIQPLKVSEEIGQLMKEHWLTETDAAKIKTTIYPLHGTGTFRFDVRAEVKEKTLHTILYDTPRRFLAFEPKDS